MKSTAIAIKSEMSVEQNINSMLLDIYRIMPSLGTYPFTMIGLAREELSGLIIEPYLVSATQLIVLKRTDFNKFEMVDYVTNTKELSVIPTCAERFPTFETVF